MINVRQASIDGVAMSTVTVSSKYQIVIPKDIREKMGIEPGQKVHFHYDGTKVVLVKVPTVKEMRGISPGIDTHVEREEDRY